MGDVGLEQPFSNHRLGLPNRSRGLQGQNYFIIIIKYLVSFSHKCTEGEKFIDVISDATLELIFKKQPTVECRCSVKEEPVSWEGYSNTPPLSNLSRHLRESLRVPRALNKTTLARDRVKSRVATSGCFLQSHPFHSLMKM